MLLYNSRVEKYKYFDRVPSLEGGLVIRMIFDRYNMVAMALRIQTWEVDYVLHGYCGPQTLRQMGALK